MRALSLVLLAACALAAAGRARAAEPPPGRVGTQFRYWEFNNGNDLRDPLVYWAPGPFHVTLEYWDRMQGRDQFRPEVGVHLRDPRRSVYTLQWRHELDQERFWAGTDQVLSHHWVGRVELSPIVGKERTDVVYSAGADYYWASYDFASATLVRDPRDGGLWVAPLRVRLATERNDWLQATLAPASRRTIGWALDAKLRWLRIGVERNDRFDFTTLDNVIWTAGVEFEVPGIRQP
jgi:hypothetical protein